MTEKLKLLFISASPKSNHRLKSAEELREVDARIRAALPADHFEIVAASAAKRSELTHLLVEHTPDIVHFSGHGDSKRGILLEDEHGNAAPVGGPALAALFSIVRGKPSIVVLDACSTKRMTRAFQHIVDYTVAMNGPIQDISAVAFATAFYDTLARGLPVPAAFGAGLAQLLVLKLPSKHTPELFIAPGALMQAPARINSRAAEEHDSAGVSIRGSVVHGSVMVARDHSIVMKRSGR